MSDLITALIEGIGGRFSRQLGIDLSSSDSGQIFRWFLAAKLFAARISTGIAIQTYLEFERMGVTSPQKVLESEWDGLVKLLDNGGYVRYDFSTATKLLAIAGDLLRLYQGDLNLLHREARDEKDLESRLKGLGKGIGNVMVNIFLRELREVWSKARPVLSEQVVLAAERLGIIEPAIQRSGKEVLEALMATWQTHCRKVELHGRVDFCDFEASLLRLGKDFCRKSKCGICPMKARCRYFCSTHDTDP